MLQEIVSQYIITFSSNQFASSNRAITFGRRTRSDAFSNFNVYVRCAGNSGELLYITFLRTAMSTILTFPEDIDPENIFFQWPDRAKN